MIYICDGNSLPLRAFCILPYSFVLSNLVVFFIAFKNIMSKGTCEFSISFIKEIASPYKINVLAIK